MKPPTAPYHAAPAELASPLRSSARLPGECVETQVDGLTLAGAERCEVDRAVKPDEIVAGAGCVGQEGRAK
jgi:hypothetical protein